MRVWVIGLLAVAVLAVTAACGDDDSPSPTATATAATVQLSVYFGNADATGHVEVKRDVPATQNLLDAAMEAVIAGPTEQEKRELAVAAVIPTGTRLLSAEVANGVATLDFSGEMLNYGGGSAMVNAIGESIRLTATSLPGIDDVEVLVEGEPDALQP